MNKLLIILIISFVSFIGYWFINTQYVYPKIRSYSFDCAFGMPNGCSGIKERALKDRITYSSIFFALSFILTYVVGGFDFKKNTISTTALILVYTSFIIFYSSLDMDYLMCQEPYFLFYLVCNYR